MHNNYSAFFTVNVSRSSLAKRWAALSLYFLASLHSIERHQGRALSRWLPTDMRKEMSAERGVSASVVETERTQRSHKSSSTFSGS